MSEINAKKFISKYCDSVTTRDGGGKFLIAKRIFAIVLIPSKKICYILPSHTFIIRYFE